MQQDPDVIARPPEALIGDLNPQQAEAVQYRGPALLIGAGAGSGKTRVLTRRIAWILTQFGAWPSQCYNYYDCDDAALKEYDKASKYQDKEDAEKQIAKEAAKAAKKGLPYTAPENPETFKDYLDKWIYGVKDNDELLDKIGGARLAKLKVVPGLGYAKR